MRWRMWLASACLGGGAAAVAGSVEGADWWMFVGFAMLGLVAPLILDEAERRP